MNPTAPPGAAPITCWNCRQHLPVGSERCVYCGSPQQSDTNQTPLVIAPHGVVTPTAAPVPHRAPETRSPLGAGFAGHPANISQRLSAFTIDAVVALLIASAAGIAFRSALMGAIVLIECVAIVVILQARTGASLGNVIAGVRVARADGPYSPGIGRSLVRGILIGAGSLVGVIGAWIIVLSSAWDNSGARRSWSDRAARTVVVTAKRPTHTRHIQAIPSVPTPTITTYHEHNPAAPTQQTPWGDPGADQSDAAPLPTVQQNNNIGISSPPSVPPPAQGAAAQLNHAAPQQHAQQTPPLTLPEPQQISPRRSEPVDAFSQSMTDARPTPTGIVPTDPNGATPAAPPTGEGLLISFDTGQREILSIAATTNLGRKPAPSGPTDTLITVRDPESTVSKTHARLEHTRSGTWITDNGSTNGTDLIDEEGHAIPVQPHIRTHVEDGVRIRIGNRVFTVSVVIGDPS